MRKSLRPLLAVAAIIGCGSIAFAQAPVAPPGGPASSPGTAPSASARSACRAQVDSQSLTGDQRKTAMRSCMTPYRDACRQQAADKGMTKGPDRKAFMHQCMQGA